MKKQYLSNTIVQFVEGFDLLCQDYVLSHAITFTAHNKLPIT